MQSNAKTPAAYIAELPPERAKAIKAIRAVLRKNMPKGYKEMMGYGMMGYAVPLSIYPDGYLGDRKTPLPYVGIASQKNHIAIYLTNVYSDQKIGDWFRAEYAKTGKKLDMGKSCVRFTKLENIPLDLIGKTVAKTSVKDLIALYEARGRGKRQ